MATPPRSALAQPGFSLVELSIVLVIIGVILTMGISALNLTRENTAYSATSSRQTAIKDALTAYIRKNARLPCPDTDFTAPDGVENRATPGDPTTACSAAYGILPYTTLGLGRDAAVDGWGGFLSYHVANTAGANTDWTITSSFRTGNTGILTVRDRVGGSLTTIASGVVAVVVSHGRNALGAYTIGGTRNTLPAGGTDERENTDGDTNYVRRTATTDDAASGGAFDDVVAYFTADDLLSPLYKEGTLKPPAALVQDIFNKVKLAVIGYTMANPSSYGGSSCTSSFSTPKCRVVISADISDGYTNYGLTSGIPPFNDLGLTSGDITDPWGQRISYQLNSTVISASSGGGISSGSPSASTVAFTLTSYGPDRSFGTSDDIALSVSVSELRAAMASLLP